MVSPARVARVRSIEISQTPSPHLPLGRRGGSGDRGPEVRSSTILSQTQRTHSLATRPLSQTQRTHSLATRPLSEAATETVLESVVSLLDERLALGL